VTAASATASVSPGARRRVPSAFYWAVSGAWLTLLVWGVVRHGTNLTYQSLILIPWILLVAVIHLLPLPGWKSAHFAVDLPVETAAALVLGPLECGLVGFVGAFDRREFTREITPTKALFNRSHTGLTYLLVSLIAHAIVPQPASSKWILLLAFVVLGAVHVINYLIVGLAISLEYGYHLPDVISRLRLGTPNDFVVTFFAWGVLGAMLAALYRQIEPWALLAFLAPTLLSRQVLSKSQAYLDTKRAYRSREGALARISGQILQERTDERRLIAADLHDEVLQPLFKVSLLAHVLKTELATGRLLEMDEDLPELLSSAEMAARTLRGLIGDLRSSTLGRGGLRPALESLVRGFTQQTNARIQSTLAAVEVEPEQELAIYQIAKEAVGNAISHSHARSIWVDLFGDRNGIVLSVRDDGSGFDPTADRPGHYGIHIMGERAESAGGSLFIDSIPGHGCTVALFLKERRHEPRDANKDHSTSNEAE
jgi:signal transduction histidine kinase